MTEEEILEQCAEVAAKVLKNNPDLIINKFGFVPEDMTQQEYDTLKNIINKSYIKKEGWEDIRPLVGEENTSLEYYYKENGSLELSPTSLEENHQMGFCPIEQNSILAWIKYDFNANKVLSVKFGG